VHLRLSATRPPGRLAAGETTFPNAHVTADWHAFLAQPVDGIVIASPSNQHFSMAWDALSAGKHVFIEKPFALSAKHAELLIEQSSRLGSADALAEQVRFAQAFPDACQRMGLSARSRYEERYSLAAGRKQLVQIYERALGARV